MLPMSAYAVSMTSPGYQIESAIVASGSGNSASAGFSVSGVTVGQQVMVGPPLESAGYTFKPVTLPTLSDQALIVSTLSNGAVTATPGFNVSGKVPTSPPTTRLSINGAPVSVNPDGTYSASISLSVGSNIITIATTNQFGVINTRIRSVTYDPTVPPIAITSLSNASVPLSQTVLPLAGVAGVGVTSIAVSVNGGSPHAITLNNGAFSGTVEISPGINTIEIIGTTLNGSRSTSAMTITSGGDVSAVIHNGDINNDAVVDIIDALLSLRCAVNLMQPTPSERARGDVAPLIKSVPMGDGQIDIEDANSILRKVVGLGW